MSVECEAIIIEAQREKIEVASATEEPRPIEYIILEQIDAVKINSKIMQ